MKRVVIAGLCSVLLACGKPASEEQLKHPVGEVASNQSGHAAYQVKPAVKLSTDASGLAQQTLSYLQQAEPLLIQPVNINSDTLEQLVFTPVRDLLVQWRMNVKQTDSVVGDQYTICRGALMSFDTWARALIERPQSAVEKQQQYLNQKKLCETAVAQGLPSRQS